MASNFKAKNNALPNQFRAIMSSKVDREFESRMQKANNNVQRFINKRLEDFSSEMFKKKDFYTPNGTTPFKFAEMGEHWMPLNSRYWQAKKHRNHFINKGRLSNVFPSNLYFQRKKLSVALGNFKLRNFKIEKLNRSGNWTTRKRTAQWSFSIFDNVYRQKFTSERILDRFLPKTKSATSSKLIPASVKFGVSKTLDKSRRNFLFSAALYYQRKVIEVELKQYMKEAIKG